MNENVNLTEILENCPAGFPLYSTVYGNVEFVEVTNIKENDIEFSYSKKTPYGIYKNIAYVNSEGKRFADCDGECTLFPSRDQRDWSKFTASWLRKKRFDPKTLKPFDRVLVRNTVDKKWECELFSHIIENTYYPYRCFKTIYVYCIPYNDETKHLIGTTEEAPEFYRYWL